MGRFDIGNSNAAWLWSRVALEMLPVNDAADDEAKSNARENEAAEFAFPERIETMNVHGVSE